MLLVGQRLGPDDLYRNRLDVKFTDEATGEELRKYQHIVFPAHNEASCDAAQEGGSHRQRRT